MKYFGFEFWIKQKKSGFYILPFFLINIHYKSVTIGIFRYFFKITLNTFDQKCFICGAICKNKNESELHCFDNAF